MMVMHTVFTYVRQMAPAEGQKLNLEDGVRQRMKIFSSVYF